jgi:hypothetical protein
MTASREDLPMSAQPPLPSTNRDAHGIVPAPPGAGERERVVGLCLPLKTYAEDLDRISLCWPRAWGGLRDKHFDM